MTCRLVCTTPLFEAMLTFLSIGSLGTNVSKIRIKKHRYSVMKMHLKISSVTWRPFCSCINGVNRTGLIGPEALHIWSLWDGTSMIGHTAQPANSLKRVGSMSTLIGGFWLAGCTCCMCIFQVFRHVHVVPPVV